MDYEVREHFKDLLLQDEYLVWCGKPNPKIHFSKRDVFMMPFSLLWGGFALFWNVSVWISGAPFFFRLFGLPFLLMGFYITFGRFFHSAYMKKRTFYAITNIRIIVLSGKNNTTAQYITDIPSETVAVHKNGSGTITFGTSFLHGYTGRGHEVITFIDIDNCQWVYREYQTVKHQIKI